MAYDEALAERIRHQLAGRAGLSEQRMFGGLAFLTGGNLAIAASGQGGLLVRVDPDESQALVAATGARPMEMRGRRMAGWLRSRRPTWPTTTRCAGGSTAAWRMPALPAKR